jgi:hypothetical protein
MAPQPPTCTCGFHRPSGEIDWGSSKLRREIGERLARNARRGIVREIQRVGRYVVPGSAALYVVGFCACVLHYYRSGVPVYSLTHSQFIAAGVLFLVLTGSALWFGVTSAAHRPRQGLTRIAIASLLLLGGCATQMGARGSLAATFYWLYQAFIAWSAVNSLLDARAVRKAVEEAAPAPRGSLAPIPHSITHWLFSLALFGGFCFPSIPQWLGGGDARRVVVAWSAPLTDVEKASVDGTDAACTWEVLSDSGFMYLMYLDGKDSRCLPEVNAGWRVLVPAVGNPLSKRRYMVVKRDRIASVVYK